MHCILSVVTGKASWCGGGADSLSTHRHLLFFVAVFPGQGAWKLPLFLFVSPTPVMVFFDSAAWRILIRVPWPVRMRISPNRFQKALRHGACHKSVEIRDTGQWPVPRAEEGPGPFLRGGSDAGIRPKRRRAMG